MSFYYLLILFSRFHNDPRVSQNLFTAGLVVVTPVKLVGLLAVVAAFVLPRPPAAAARLKNPLAWLWVIFLLLQVAGTLVRGLPLPLVSTSSLISFSLMFVVTRRLVTTEERMRKTVRAMILGSTLASLWLYRQYFIQHFSRPSGIEQDPNYEALTLLVGVPLAFWMARYEVSRWWRAIALGCTLDMCGGVILTQSRGGLIAAIAMVIAVVALSRRKLLATALAVTMLLVGLAVAPDSIMNRFENMKLHGPITNGDEKSSRIHYELLKAGMRMIESEPWLGVGLGRFKTLAPQYNPAIYWVSGRAYIAHNTYMQIAAESGLPVLSVFLLLLLVGALNLRQVRAVEGAELSDLAFAMELGMIGFAVAGAGVSAEFVTSFWLVLFLSVNLREISHAKVAHGEALAQGVHRLRPAYSGALARRSPRNVAAR
jgi:O-antigen ligase